jgi:hypothetical protein
MVWKGGVLKVLAIRFHLFVIFNGKVGASVGVSASRFCEKKDLYRRRRPHPTPHTLSHDYNFSRNTAVPQVLSFSFFFVRSWRTPSHFILLFFAGPRPQQTHNLHQY